MIWCDCGSVQRDGSVCSVCGRGCCDACSRASGGCVACERCEAADFNRRVTLVRGEKKMFDTTPDGNRMQT